MLISYLYKTLFSLATTPLFYVSVFLVKKNWKLSLAESFIKHRQKAQPTSFI